MGIKKSTTTALKGFRSFTAKHRLAAFCMLLIILVWSASMVVAWNHFESLKVANEAAQQQTLAELDKNAERIKAENEEKLKLEEEKKAKKAEEAGKTTESSQAVNPGTEGCTVASTHNNSNSIDVLVNKKHCLGPLSFTPPDLLTTHEATISAKAADSFNRMFADAASAGQPFTVSSSYRSYSNQVSTYNYWVSLNGQQGADTVSARPGYSEHQTGLAVDVGANGCNLNCFADTSQYQWFQANAASYGFIQRYYSGYEGITGYSSEEWHYRYVGVAVAQDMKAKGIKTLEQYWGIDGGDYN